MTVVKTKDLESALLSKGFRRDNRHHRYYWLYDGEKKTSVKTFLSHGFGEYGDNLLAQIRKGLGLENKRQLLDLIQCPMSQQDLIDYLRATGRIRST